MKKRPVHMKYPHHVNLAKGGAVIQKFADGGAPMTPTNTAPQPIGDLPQGGTGGVNMTAATGAGQTGLTGTLADLTGTQNQFQGQAANINPGTNAEQLNTAYGGVQNTLGQQGQIANQLAHQVGSAVNNQNFLANQYAQMAQGQGPNPAQSELNTATGQNVANQAALMAGQRGASANAGLLARQAAQQGASTQQQAVGQAATLGAQQQIAAQQNLANLSNNQVVQAGNATGAASGAQQNEQNILQNANTSLNNAAVGMQSNLNNVNSQTAAANQNNNINVAKGIGGALSGIPAIGGVLSGLFEHGGPVHPMAEGGQIAPDPLTTQPVAQDAWMAPVFSQAAPSNGPEVPATSTLPAFVPMAAPKSGGAPAAPGGISAGQGMNTVMAGGAGDAGGAAAGGASMADLAMFAYSGGRIAKGPHLGHVANFLAGGGVSEVKAIVSPKEVYLSPDQVHKVVHEGADPMKIGHKFPGTDKVKGKDSKKNDVIPTTLQDGGCVIPVHITTHKDASRKSRKFVARTMAKHMKRPAGAK